MPLDVLKIGWIAVAISYAMSNRVINNIGLFTEVEALAVLLLIDSLNVCPFQTNALSWFFKTHVSC